MFVDDMFNYKLYIIGFIISLMIKYWIIYMFEKDLMRVVCGLKTGPDRTGPLKDIQEYI